MSNVLFLVHRIPYPPNKGDKIRSYYLLRHLCKNHNVYLGAFIDDPRDEQHIERMRRHCAGVFFRPIGGWRSRVSAFFALLKRQSLSIGYYADAEMSRWAADTVREADIDLVVAFSSTMAQFVPVSGEHAVRCVADFVDLDSDKWRQFANEASWYKSLIYSYEAAALSRWEIDVSHRVDAVAFVSEEEKRLMRQRARTADSNVCVIRNGVDHEFFDPQMDFESPYAPGRRAVVFTGAMDYFANEDGVCWFADSVWPGIREAHPETEFWVVGSNPTQRVQDLDERDGITVTGFVDDVRPYLKHADLAVAPLALARGVQNKVLEALAMCLPVVATPQALQGLDGDLPPAVTSVSGAEDFLRAVKQALTSVDGVSNAAGRGYVQQFYDWDKNLEELSRVVVDMLEPSAESRPAFSA